MFQKFILKRMLKNQLKGVPQEQQDMIITAIEKNPDLFKKIAKEIEEKTKKGGMDQMMASMQVMKKYQNELRDAMLGGQQ